MVNVVPEEAVALVVKRGAVLRGAVPCAASPLAASLAADALHANGIVARLSIGRERAEDQVALHCEHRVRGTYRDHDLLATQVPAARARLHLGSRGVRAKDIHYAAALRRRILRPPLLSHDAEIAKANAVASQRVELDVEARDRAASVLE